jgi:hypothetical protein
MKRGTEKEGNVKEKGRKTKEKGRKGKEKEIGVGKRVQSVQNREELRQTGHERIRKITCHERGKKYYFSQKGGGNKYRFNLFL